MALLQSVLEILGLVMALVLLYYSWRHREVKQALHAALNGWEKQVAQTEILYAIEEEHANYMVEQDFDEKFEIARLRIRERVEAASKGRPSSELTSPSGIRRQREKIDTLRAKLNVPDPL